VVFEGGEKMWEGNEERVTVYEPVSHSFFHVTISCTGTAEHFKARSLSQ